MVYKRYNKRRTYGVRRRYNSSTRRLKPQASKKRVRLANLANQRTGGLLGIETKYFDAAAANLALAAPTNSTGGEMQPSAGCTGCLSAPGQGDGASNRDGRKCVLKSLLVNGVIKVAAQSAQSTADVSCDVFLALVQDTQTNRTTINSEDVFQNNSNQAAAATVPFRNMSNISRFKVLKSKNIPLRIPSIANDTGATGGLVQFGFHTPFKLSWKGVMPVNFLVGGTTADVANVIDNSIHLIAYCSNTTLAPTIDFASRARFVG